MFFAYLYCAFDNFIVIIRRLLYLFDARHLRERKKENVRDVNICDCRKEVIFHFCYLVFSVASVEIRDFVM